MQKPYFPMKYVSITQIWGSGTYSHQNLIAIDFVAKGNESNQPVYAPCDVICKRIYEKDAHEVWFQSTDKVLCADGSEQYICFMFAHSDDVSFLEVGKVYKQFEPIYYTGTYGNVTAPHCHLEVGIGEFTGNGWSLNKNKVWEINNAVPPNTILWLESNMIVASLGKLTWSEDTNEEVNIPDMEYKVGDEVVITGSYSSSKNGDDVNKKAVGWKRTILEIVDGKNMYRLGNESGTTGYAPLESIKHV